MELEVGKRKRGRPKDGLIASRRIWKWLESKKRTQEREIPGEQQSAPAIPLRMRREGEIISIQPPI